MNPAEIAGQPPEVQRQYFGERPVRVNIGVGMITGFYAIASKLKIYIYICIYIYTYINTYTHAYLRRVVYQCQVYSCDYGTMSPPAVLP